MRRLLPTVLVVLLGVAVAFALRAQFRSRPAAPSPVPDGDYEIAWIHTTTTPQTWERLVAAMFQIRREYPVEVDASRAFLDQTAAVPEVVLSVPGRSDKIRVRWYKLSGEVGNQDWVRALAGRNPPPIAFMGGGSSDRAIELAQALDKQGEWKGARPLLFITTATANTVIDPDTNQPESLLKLYEGRTFRGCFTNEAMAGAVVDFVWQAEDLRPVGRPAAQAYVLSWEDDPYSVDLAEQFRIRFAERQDLGAPLHTVPGSIEYSVGTFAEPNPRERRVLDRVLPDLAAHPEDRSLLVLPAVTQPARRMLRAFAADSPLIGRKRLVAVTGDGVSFNTVYRDGEVAWPVRELAIPLVFFAHQDPVAWSGGGTTDPAPLHPPTATDDVLLFADIVRVLAKGIYLQARVDADGLADKLRAGNPPFFNPDGERRSGEGEYVVVFRPQFVEPVRAADALACLVGGPALLRPGADPAPGEAEQPRVHREAMFEVYTRRAGRWELVRRLFK